MGKLIGYVGTKDLMEMKESDILALDVINIAFGHIKGNEIVWETSDGAAAIKRLHEIHPSIRVLLSIGGWSSGGFSEMAMTKEGRVAFANSAVQLLHTYGLDGIDLDWEYPCSSIAGIASSPKDKENFTLLLKELRETFDRINQHWMLTIAAGGDSYYTRQTNMKEAIQYLDYVQLMTYDLQGGFQTATGHHTSLYSSMDNLFDACVDKAVHVFMQAGVPAEKIVIGVAFYSRLWKIEGAVGTGLGLEASSVGGYGPDFGTLTKDYINCNGFVRHWDDAAKAPYLYNGSEFISYDDEESIACKIEYAKEKGLCGIMYWEYCCDGTGTLTTYMRKQLNEALQD